MQYQDILDKICDWAQNEDERGDVADYIPELAKVDTDQFGISLWLADGRQFSAGDAKTTFSIQSVSKVFVLAIALGRVGDQLWSRVGREPSGKSFDSITQLEIENGRPRNPFINAGAIVTTDTVLAGNSPKETLGELLRFVRLAAADDDIHIDKVVAASELKHGHHNAALASYMASHGNLENPVELTLGTYFHQCAIQMTCEQLARAGAFLVNGDQSPNLVGESPVKRINALMLTCGHYDGSGDFAYRVGLPAKSGVGGGILALIPKVGAVAVWSPGLNEYGNSKLGTLAMERLTKETGWSIFA